VPVQVLPESYVAGVSACMNNGHVTQEGMQSSKNGMDLFPMVGPCLCHQSKLCYAINPTFVSNVVLSLHSVEFTVGNSGWTVEMQPQLTIGNTWTANSKCSCCSFVPLWIRGHAWHCAPNS